MADLRVPRMRKITAVEYFKHLMRFKDGRFAKDPHFRSFAYNSLSRWQASDLGDVYVKQHPDNLEDDVDAMRGKLAKGDDDFVKRISCRSAKIRGYWGARLADLIAMVQQVGPPTIYMTLTAADTSPA